MKKTFLLLMTVAMAASSASATIVSVFGPGAYNADSAAMNTTLGLTGSFALEDFESLPAGTPASAALPSGITLSRTFQTQVGSDVNRTWDGGQYLESRWDSGFLTFTLPYGVEKIGVGVGGNIGFDVQLLINGGSQTTVSNDADWVYNNIGRNGYITVETESGDPLITSFALRNTSATDWMAFDHIAFGSVPEPSSSLMLGAALCVLGLARRRRGGRVGAE